MKQYIMTIMLLVFVAGCQPVAPSATPTAPLQATFTATMRPTASPSPTASPTATPVTIGELSLEAPTLWELVDTRTKDTAPLVEDASGGMRLDPDWQIARAEFVYQWWGMGDPDLINHVIELQNGDYLQDGQTAVPQTQMVALVQAVRRLYPTGGYLDSIAHSDDYPSWDIELLGTDGTYILLHSEVNSNRARMPWNVFVNGRFYAQYDGRLAGPLSVLFDERLDPDLGHDLDLDGNPRTRVPMGSSQWPTQFVDGFMGLLPIAGSFRYHADIEQSSIVGYIIGRNIIGFSGLIRQGAITGLTSLHLETDGKRIDCTFEPLEGRFDYDAGWEFACPLAGVKAGDVYEYAIFVDLATAEGDPVTTKGVLTGTWGTKRDVLIVPGPEPLMSLLAANEQAASILDSHILAYVDYSGTLQLGLPIPDSLTGTAHFLGQASVDGTSIRYTLTRPFTIEGGKLVHWTVNIEDIKTLLHDVLAEPVTWRVINGRPETVINLWYSTYDESLLEGGATLHTRICPDDGVDLPEPDIPLRAFGFEQESDYFRYQFLFDEDGKVIPEDLDFLFEEDDPLIELLLPNAFRPEARDGIESMRLGNSYRDNFTIYIANDVSEQDYYALRDWAKSLPFAVDITEYETIWEAKDTIGYFLNDWGGIEFVVCEAEE